MHIKTMLIALNATLLGAAAGAQDLPQQDIGGSGAVATPAPAGWADPGFDDSAWPAAFEHAARSVGPKDANDQIDWHRSAAIIWGSDLHLDNILLCRVTIER